MEFALLLIKHVFTNADGSTGIHYLVAGDTALTGRGWPQSIKNDGTWKPLTSKQNASLEKSSTQTVTTPTNHFFAALYGYIKLELLKGNAKRNHFALKSKLYLSAIHAACARWRELNPALLAA